MAFLIKNGQQSNKPRVFLGDSSSTTGAGLTGLTFASSGLIISTACDNESAPTVYTVAASHIETITTLGTYAAPTASKCRFKEYDPVNHPGIYEIQIANARFAVAGARQLVITISGAANLVETNYEIQLTGAVLDPLADGLVPPSDPALIDQLHLLTSGITAYNSSTHVLTLDVAANSFDAGQFDGMMVIIHASEEDDTHEVRAIIASNRSTPSITLDQNPAFTPGTGDTLDIWAVPRQLPAAVPGASGGLLRSGANAGTTTLGALTVTGTATISDGLVIARSTTDSNGCSITGNGTGHGLVVTSGSGNAACGVIFAGNGVHGSGLIASGSGHGNGMQLVGGNGAVQGAGLRIFTNGSAGIGLQVNGNGTGAGAVFTSGAGATGSGVEMTAASTNGSGLKLTNTGSGTYPLVVANSLGTNAVNQIVALDYTVMLATTIEAANDSTHLVLAASFANDNNPIGMMAILFDDQDSGDRTVRYITDYVSNTGIVTINAAPEWGAPAGGDRFIIVAVAPQIPAIKTKTDFLPSAASGSAGGLLTYGTGSGQINPVGGRIRNTSVQPAQIENRIVFDHGISGLTKLWALIHNVGTPSGSYWLVDNSGYSTVAGHVDQDFAIALVEIGNTGVYQSAAVVGPVGTPSIAEIRLASTSVQISTDPLLGTVVLGSVSNVTKWGSSTIPAPSTVGVPRVDLRYVAGAVLDPTVAQIGSNVINFGGTAGTFAAGIPSVNAAQLGASVPAVTALRDFAINGYDSTDHVVNNLNAYGITLTRMGYLDTLNTGISISGATINAIRDAITGGKTFIAGSINDTVPTTGGFKGSSNFSASNSFYSNQKSVVTFTSGALTGMSNKITGYTGATRLMSFSAPWSAAPANGDTFVIMGRIG